MKSVQFAWVLGAVSAMGLGMAAEACSSSSTTTGNSSTSSSTTSTSGVTGSSGSASTSGVTTGSTATTGTTSSTSSRTSPDGGECYSAPTTVFAEDGGSGLYCPFSEVDGGKDIYCTTGQHCCSPPESANQASMCMPEATECPNPKDVDWVCEGTPNCSNVPGTICCGQGTILTQMAQPGCALDGGTIQPYPYVSEFYGTACQKSCAVFGDGGAGFQVCSKDSECPAGDSCIAVKPKGNSIGYCGPSTGSGTGSSSSTTSTTTSSSTTSASSTSGTSSTSSSSN